MSSFSGKGENEKFCPNCGNLIHIAAEICPKCGVRQHWPVPHQAPNGRHRLVAALFAFFLGTFGVHKFYLGQVGMGIVYLLFCWTGIPSIIGFIEGVLLLVMSDAKFIQKYGYS